MMPSSNAANNMLLNQIAALIEQSRSVVRSAVNQTMVQCYWQIGQLIVKHEQQGEARAAYGKQQLKQLSEALTARFGKGFDVTNLRNMRQFYLLFPIRDAVRRELSWTHYRRLLRVDNEQARAWYIQEANTQGWSARALDRQISKLYDEHLLSSQQPATVIAEAEQQTHSLQDTIQDYLRDPYILDFLNLSDKPYRENDVETAIISHLQHFLLELGKGFAFVERQKRIHFEEEDFYIDLVFYNFKLKCFLLIDLKLGRLKHQDIGQMDTYIRLYDEQYKSADDNPTIGLILCSEKSEAVVHYSVLSDAKQMFAAKYLPYLPSEAELKKQLEQERARLNATLNHKP